MSHEIYQMLSVAGTAARLPGEQNVMYLRCPDDDDLYTCCVDSTKPSKNTLLAIPCNSVMSGLGVAGRVPGSALVGASLDCNHRFRDEQEREGNALYAKFLFFLTQYDVRVWAEHLLGVENESAGTLSRNDCASFLLQNLGVQSHCCGIVTSAPH